MQVHMGTHKPGETDGRTDWPGEKRVKRDGGEEQRNHKTEREKTTATYRIPVTCSFSPGLHIFSPAHPHTETEACETFQSLHAEEL